MLQQILRDMWVDPELLAELDDTQKQTLFCKMRAEQVRRWQVWDQKVSKEEERPKVQKNSKKQVQFLKGEDGEPWVWVMGEHPEDKSIESILAEEARQRALAQAREEAHQLRKSVEKELTQLIDYKPLDSLEQKFDLSPKSIESLEDNLDMYCSVEDLRQRIEALEPEVAIDKEDIDTIAKMEQYCNDNINLDINKNTLHFNFIEGKRDVLQELVVCAGGAGVSGRVAAWERRVAAARAGDILRALRARRARDARHAHQHATRDHALWKDQERRAKEAEAAMREIARAAREAHRRSASLADSADSAARTTEKPSPEDIVEWFRTHELKRGVGLDENNKPVDWFHGVISRTEAERALHGQPDGQFVVRVSSSARGYALSVRSKGHTRHFLVQAADTYRLLGEHRAAHTTLADLINYHKSVPITESGGELLTSPCAPADTPHILTPLP